MASTTAGGGPSSWSHSGSRRIGGWIEAIEALGQVVECSGDPFHGGSQVVGGDHVGEGQEQRHRGELPGQELGVGNGFYAVARRARDSGDGAFHPTLAVASRETGDAVEITVRDNGAGIPPEIKDKLFQPFFTTKPTGEGTGLGLSISYDIVTQQHGGTITVESEPGAYTEFTIRLPRRAAAGGGA